MIRNETEYQAASTRLKEESQRLSDHRMRLRETGLDEAAIKRVIDPIESFHLQLQEGSGALGLWGSGALGLWGSGALGLWGSWV